MCLSLTVDWCQNGFLLEWNWAFYSKSPVRLQYKRKRQYQHRDLLQKISQIMTGLESRHPELGSGTQEQDSKLDTAEYNPRAISNVARIAGTQVPRWSLFDFHTKRLALKGRLSPQRGLRLPQKDHLSTGTLQGSLGSQGWTFQTTWLTPGALSLSNEKHRRSRITLSQMYRSRRRNQALSSQVWHLPRRSYPRALDSSTKSPVSGQDYSRFLTRTLAFLQDSLQACEAGLIYPPIVPQGMLGYSRWFPVWTILETSL